MKWLSFLILPMGTLSNINDNVWSNHASNVWLNHDGKEYEKWLVSHFYFLKQIVEKNYQIICNKFEKINDHSNSLEQIHQFKIDIMTDWWNGHIYQNGIIRLYLKKIWPNNSEILEIDKINESFGSMTGYDKEAVISSFALFVKNVWNHSFFPRLLKFVNQVDESLILPIVNIKS